MSVSEVPELLSGQVHIWWVRKDQVLPHLRDLLSPVELERMAAYRLDADRNRFMLGASLLRLGAASYLDTEPTALKVDRSCGKCDRPHGKTTLPGTGLETSISHSGDLIGVAFALDRPIGLDVEQLTRTADLDALARSVLTPNEQSHFASASDEARPQVFYRFWTRKEAMVKATAEGIGSLSKVDAVTGAPGMDLHDLTPPSDDCLAALAVLSDSRFTPLELDATTLLG